MASRGERHNGATQSAGSTPGTTASPQAPHGAALSAQDIARVLSERFHVGLGEASKIGHAVLAAAKREAISPFLLLAVIAMESGFDPKAHIDSFFTREGRSFSAS
jgi:hypothetical protein